MNRVVELTAWTTPDSYVGFDPVGHILAASMHRESSILDQSNYWTMWHRLEDAYGPIIDLADLAHDGPFSRFDPKDTPLVYTWEASSSLVGWHRYLMVRPCEDSWTLINAVVRPVLEALADYPVLSDADYRERQMEAMQDYWDHESLKDRIRWCAENDTSIFAARSGYPPERVEEHWSQEIFA